MSRNHTPNGFSRQQQGRYFRPQVARAWAAHCRRTSDNFFDAVAKDKWYRAALMECLQVYTTKECNQKEDFETAMAHFEAIEGVSIEWQMKAAHGDKIRVMWLINKRLKALDQPESYADDIAHNAGFGDVDDCQHDQLVIVLRALDMQLRRHGPVHHQHAQVAS